jgi:hypothetical protein
MPLHNYTWHTKSAPFVDLEIVTGGCSVGLPLLPKEEMVLSHAIFETGQKDPIHPISCIADIGTVRLVISNFCADVPRHSVNRGYGPVIVRASPPIVAG